MNPIKELLKHQGRFDKTSTLLHGDPKDRYFPEAGHVAQNNARARFWSLNIRRQQDFVMF